MHKKYRLMMVLAFLVFSGHISAENEAGSAGGGQKEQDFSDLKTRIELLERQLAGAKSIITESVPARERGYIETLERKALAYEVASSAIAEREKVIKDLTQKLKDLDAENGDLRVQVKTLTTAADELASEVEVLKKEGEPLKEALELIRKGKFEYYQIREGDTCESIAAKPSIYNDESKHILIRQANRGGVKDLDKLVPGEVLVIPRFSLGESYEL